LDELQTKASARLAGRGGGYFGLEKATETKRPVLLPSEQDHLRLKLAPLEQSGNRWGEERIERFGVCGRVNSGCAVSMKYNQRTNLIRIATGVY
jgi:hypothetical protein